MESDEDIEVMDVEESEESLEDESEDEEHSPSKPTKSAVYLPGKPLKRGEELVCDESAYVMLHQAFTGSPCLSFDIIKDELGSDRESFPLTAYVVAGTQSDRAHTNSIFVMKMSNLKKTHKQKKNSSNDEDDSESSSDEEENSTNKPKLDCARIKHKGCINRIRSTHYGGSVLAATWSELGRVEVWNLTRQLQAIDDSRVFANYKQTNAEETTTPVFSFSGHQMEGFGLDWCSTEPGVLASGDCQRNIHVWLPDGASSWIVNQRPLIGHTESVEDLQWSPNEKNVLASCSVDKTIRIWDVRVGAKKANMLTVEAHTSDVNVISWNRNEPFICSGGDDGFLHVWDLRQFKEAVVTFKHHTGPVTSVEWHPSEATVLASSGTDDQIALWDLSLERDEEAVDEDLKDLPPQLLFIHQGQTDLKELHWHPQLPGVLISTALSGFNIFRTISL